MEMCDKSLKEFFHDIRKFFSRDNPNQFQPMSEIEYLISSLIYLRIIFCVNHLHCSKPPIIHRDIKPSNILMKFHTQSGNRPPLRPSFRLCDFGLAKFHGDREEKFSFNKSASMSHTRVMGTTNYCAPEVDSSRYSTKADIYSLGVTGKEIFGHK